MCGRSYSTYTEDELEARYDTDRRKRHPLLEGLQPNYNCAPTHLAPVIVGGSDGRVIEFMKWGLIPPWEPEFKTKLSTINAKSETVFASRLYKDPIHKTRCIVPISGFFEWKRMDDRKRPFAIQLVGEPIMSVAGVWAAWHPGGPDEGRSFSILTTSANGLMSQIHDRMPVILGRDAERAWLDPHASPAAIEALLKPCPDEWLTMHEVSTLVNSPRNNVVEILTPI
jgi:putative SOS response-associated peptidase YedK